LWFCFAEQLRIKLNPNRQVVRPGDNALITCEATGEQPITITWERLRDPMPRSVQTYGGRLQFQGIAVSDAGRYICRATNRNGAADATAEVIVEGRSKVTYSSVEKSMYLVFCQIYAV
jgi:Immunoglobulin domain